jgi:hypothetical protein
MRCSFCSKVQAEVRKLVAGPAVFICNECVEACVDIMRGEHDVPPQAVVRYSGSESAHSTAVVMCKLCGLPVPRVEALVIAERGFLCGGCCGEIEASVARQRVNVGGAD